MRRRVAWLSLAPSLVIVIAACGVPGSSEYRPIGGEDVAELLDTTTSTTTTTTSTTTTTIPETTLTLPVTTTTVALQPVELYFVSGEQLTAVRYPLAPGASAQQLLNILAEGVQPLQPATAGTRSAIPSDARFEVEIRPDGVAEVDMNRAALTTNAGDGPLEFGQIVMTLLSNVPGVGQVKFSVLGVPQAVTRGDGSEVSPDVAVSRADYETLLP